MEVVVSFDLDEREEQVLIEPSHKHIKDQLLMGVTDKLQEARLQALEVNDRLFIYLIDVAIFYACETLTNHPDLGASCKTIQE